MSGWVGGCRPPNDPLSGSSVMALIEDVELCGSAGGGVGGVPDKWHH